MIELLVAGIRPEAHERPFWDGARGHRLVLQRCQDCGHFQHYPRSVCVRTLGNAFEYVESPGRGTIHSFTVVRRAPLPQLRPLAPYTLALIDLDEGVRLTSTVIGDPAGVRIGLPVVVDFAQVSETITLPIFRPAPDLPGET